MDRKKEYTGRDKTMKMSEIILIGLLAVLCVAAIQTFYWGPTLYQNSQLYGINDPFSLSFDQNVACSKSVDCNKWVCSKISGDTSEAFVMSEQHFCDYDHISHRYIFNLKRFDSGGP